MPEDDFSSTPEQDAAPGAALDGLSADDLPDDELPPTGLLDADPASAGESLEESAETAVAAADGNVASIDETAPDLDQEEPPPAPPQSPYDRPGQWYVIHSYAGYENKVKSNLESRIASMNMEERIFEVVIPMEDVIEFKNGKKQVVS